MPKESEKRVIEVESCKACPNVEHKWDNERDCLVYRCNEIPDKEESNHLYAEVNPAEIPANCPLPLANKKEGKPDNSELIKKVEALRAECESEAAKGGDGIGCDECWEDWKDKGAHCPRAILSLFTEKGEGE